MGIFSTSPEKAGTPTVSVIVPNYNHERFLTRRIESVLQQTYQDFELILLDDCSTDNSRKILESYTIDPRVTVDFNISNSGTTFKQWNKGVRLARGKYVWMAESDDFADKRLLERLVAKLDAGPDITFAFCRSIMVLADESKVRFADEHLAFIDATRWTQDYSADGTQECRRFMTQRNIVPNASAVVFRRLAYEYAGGADESLRLAGDWKLWAALALQGRVEYLGEAMNYFRCHGTTVRATTNRDGIEALEALTVTRWIANQTYIDKADWPIIRKSLRGQWLGAATTRALTPRLRWKIVRAAAKLDPGAYLLVLRTLLGRLATKPGNTLKNMFATMKSRGSSAPLE